MLKNKQKRSARLEARLTPGTFKLVQRAATLQGRSVSDFVVTAAQEAAEAVIQRREIVALSRDDQERFAAALLSPGRIKPALRRAAAARRRLLEPS